MIGPTSLLFLLIEITLIGILIYYSIRKKDITIKERNPAIIIMLTTLIILQGIIILT
ncbi:hypothetical protein [Tenacibaculum maritimum]|uniref:hypothetical protein n=1 Tax=Tenacibaculum maritimum TaxID=107401 RepID=UPI00387682FA